MLTKNGFIISSAGLCYRRRVSCIAAIVLTIFLVDGRDFPLEIFNFLCYKNGIFNLL
ncbi:hypothetical protein [Candidatus Steffania adelgidicola]|uniref:hypothetical protein n=1 Tax=Candidatus Steffania adelgidicola TaxID=1076626 RepID=UPI001D0242FA|nr:hypothetical protein [Candidatus Steffania adelgidicola]